jgi:hypothetical protein
MKSWKNMWGMIGKEINGHGAMEDIDNALENIWRKDQEVMTSSWHEKPILWGNDLKGKTLRNVLENLFLFKLLDNSSSKNAMLTYPSTTRKTFVLPNIINHKPCLIPWTLFKPIMAFPWKAHYSPNKNLGPHLLGLSPPPSPPNLRGIFGHALN